MPTLRLGDSLDVLRTLPEGSVDAVVTDPPYGLSFMGKRWDYDVPEVELWAECLRVLKPGGHLLAFAGTRTQHRMAVRIEDAGFEIRDMIAWVYGSGMPKSLDVSKAIDKQDAVAEQQARRFRFTAWVCSTGAKARQIDEATGTVMGNHYTTHPTQPAIMTREHLEQCRHLLGEVPAWVEQEADVRSVESQNFKNREVVGTRLLADTTKATAGFIGSTHSPGYDGSKREVPTTLTHTPEAQQWAGWGTALKPALEPVTVARKPLGEKTIAANVLAHGTGAINVDGCRVEGVADRPGTTPPSDGARGCMSGDLPRQVFEPHDSGRWPANLILDGSDEAVDPLGSAARFFYCPKASKRERGEGNVHPTVKPVALMAYLCRLVTPPGGLVLDPFMGSGSTGLAALAEGFEFLGIERDPDYLAIAEERIARALSDSAGAP